MQVRFPIIVAAAAVLFASGCNRSEERVQPRVLPAHHPAVAGEQQNPYYYGLIEEYKTLLAEDPNNLAALIALANAYCGSGQWKKAIAIYEHALLIDPHNADVRTDMGIAYRNVGQPDRALAEFQKAIKSDPVHQNARYQMGLVYAYDKKDYARATRAWNELLRISPHHPEADFLRHSMTMFKQRAGEDAR